MTDEPEAEQFSSRIEEVSEERIVLAMPMSKGVPVVLAPGEKFYGRMVVDGIAYWFTSTLLEKRHGPLPVWIAALPTDIRKIQLRAFVRLEIPLKVQAKVIAKDGTKDDQENLPLGVMTTKDISGGGIQLISRHPLRVGTRLQLNIELPEIGTLPLLGDVVRIVQPEEKRQVFWIGIRFVDIQEKDRRQIIRFIYQKQLEKRKKSRLLSDEKDNSFSRR